VLEKSWNFVGLKEWAALSILLLVAFIHSCLLFVVKCDFWFRDELAKLNGTGIVEAVERDLKSIEREFNSVVLPFVVKHPSVFP